MLVGLTAFFTAWNDPTIPTRTLVSVSMLPALAVLGTRFFGEGFLDAGRAAKPGTPENAARVVRAVGTVVQGVEAVRDAAAPPDGKA